MIAISESYLKREMEEALKLVKAIARRCMKATAKLGR